ncbi:MAG: 6-bladed beta-propeller [Balneolaceae bacterium]|nr:6-bladed beta-propeller [Balneolaceae bacterium]MCH8548069.1 6-bladed beta-propeller [Balneolaceae bacterium]
MKITSSLLLFFAVLACSEKDNTSVYHPTEENLTQLGNYHFNVINVSDTKEKSPNILSNSYIESLSLINNGLTIGVQYGDENQTFGRIKDITLDSSNRIYILDSQRQNIRVFNTSGEYLTTLGGRGRGPGELQSARSMAVYENEFLLVNNGYQIVVYNIANEPIEYLKTIPLEKFVHSICVMENKLFLHSPSPLDPKDISEEKSFTNMIHSYSLPSFEFQFSFGQSYKRTNPFIVERMTMGNLSCNRASSTVLFTFERMQVIHGYSANDGELLWKNRIDGLSLPMLTENNEGGRPSLTYQMPDDNLIDQISATRSLYTDSEYELFQVIRADVPEIGNLRSERSSKVYSFLLKSTDGEGLYLGNQIPEIKFMANNRITSVDFLDGYTSVNLTKLDEGNK